MIQIPLGTHVTDIVCPFCEWRTGRCSRAAAIPKVAGHVRIFHRDRLAAQQAYQAALEAGKSADEALRIHNRLLATGPGRYGRTERLQ